ncbi:MAG: tetratricopeptide repeat protein [Bacteroidia bacterium]|nr:tetratricopeptide repeat protein [Bacteroidia bacterium]
MKKIACILFILLFCSAKIRAQSGWTAAELLQALNKPQPDSILIDIYNELSWPVYSYNIPDSAIYYSEKAIALSKTTGDLKRLSIAHRRMGIAYINTGDFKKSIHHQEESLRLSEEIGFNEGISKALNNLGVIYLNNELFNKALFYFLKSLKLAEINKDQSTLASLYNNCGVIYLRTGEYKQASQFLNRAIKFGLNNQNPDQLMDVYTNLSAAYRNQKKLDSSLYCMQEATRYLSKESNRKALFSFYTGQGLLFSTYDSSKKAMNFFLLAKESATNKTDEITSIVNIAEEHLKSKNYPEAIKAFKSAFLLSEELKAYQNLTYLSKMLFEINEKTGNYTEMVKYTKAHLAYRDSNDKYLKTQQLRQQQLEFDYERKQVADSLKFAQREAIKNMELEVAETKLNREKLYRFALLLLLGSVVLLAVFLYNRFFVTRKQNQIIARQKEIVDLKNKEILDSINYAKRLQSAILPPLEKIKQHLDFDIFYLPKDIIGGDFYFFETLGTKLYLAVCDCTGHGVPGAIMSVVCHQALKKSIHEFGLNKAHEILTQSRELVMEQLHAPEQNIKDGMDCSLIVIDTVNFTYSWAGAYNPLWIWENGAFTELKADKQPVAFYENAVDFTEQEGHLSANSFVCMLSDGYPDQFGGEKGKKFKQKQLRELLESSLHKNCEDHIRGLKSTFIKWKGNLDQVDDVALAVFRLKT